MAPVIRHRSRLRHLLRLAAPGRNCVQPRKECLGIVDRVVIIPGSPSRGHLVRQHYGSPAAYRHLLQLKILGDESEPLSIRREERTKRSLRARYGRALET